ncbi:5-formyltetrahydrofolate cyclo-ligase [Streptomyces sp. NPDC051561]|uniref:5-formyltetrahydrofolate cyclo-ligase n=1 Tax=Streptomyces sp. NPDC051561 TaxID=3365658 RepID=UPI0037B45889
MDDAEMAALVTTKAALRRELLDRRRLLTVEDAREAAAVLARRALELPELAAGTVAAYVSVGREPGTRALLDALHARGVRVLLPVLMPDNDLDWAAYEGAESLAKAGRGLLEPTGRRLGLYAVQEADTVLLPGLAVDGRGMRLGRGGGSYDRVLARLGGTRGEARGLYGVQEDLYGVEEESAGLYGLRETPDQLYGVQEESPQLYGVQESLDAGDRSPGGRARLVVLLYENEVVAEVPVEPHDHPVHAVVTPAGVRRFG